MRYWKLERIYESILENANGREIVVWGTGKASQEAVQYLQEKGINISFLIVSKGGNEENVRVASELLEDNIGKMKYYIVIPLDYHKEILDQLNNSVWESKIDYIYITHEPIEISLEGNYSDEYGNIIRCGSNIENIELIKIKLIGSGITINLGNNIKVESEIHILCDNDAEINIGDEVFLFGKHQWLIWKNAKLNIENKCRLSENGILESARNAIIKIGKDTRIGKNYKIIAHINTNVFIGRECDISVDLIIRTNDGHSIFDIKTRKNINVSIEENKNINLYVGNHVWIGARCMILGNVKIGEGSIIGAYSLVKGKIPNNCIVAGSVAKIIRKDIAWSRENYAEDMDIISKEYINYTREE